MADKKISQLTDGTSLQSGDFVVVARSGDNFKVDPTQFGSSIDVTGTVTADGLTVDGTGNFTAVGIAGAAIRSDLSLPQDSAMNFTAGNATVNEILNLNLQNEETAKIQFIGVGTSQQTDIAISTGTAGAVTQAARFSANGDISFYEDTGTTAKLRWDASAESLGIGTASPAADLHISNATGSVLRIDTGGGTNADSVLNFRENGVDRASLYWDGVDNDLYLETTAGDIALMPSGNVGIGTTSPINPLDVIGSTDANIATFSTLGDGGGASNRGLSIAADTYGGSIRTVGTGVSMGFDVNGSEAMRIDSSGNVGIGTSSPGYLLHVSNSNSGGDVAASINNPSNSTNGSATLRLSTSSITTRGAFIRGLSTFVNGQPTDLLFGTGGAYQDATERMRITSSGNVGIGTTSPDQTLHTSSSAAIQVCFQSTGSVSSDIIQTSTAGSTTLRSSSGAFLFYTNGQADNTSANAASFRMTIASNGRVGIGTSSPGTTLHLQSANPVIRLQDSNGSGEYAEINANSISGSLILQADEGNTASGSFVAFRVDASEVARIDSSGNLLVGTTDSTLASTTDPGVVLTATGEVTAARSGNVCLLNRLDSDGTIAEFRKDGTVVGSIGSESGVRSYIVLDPRTAGAGITAAGSKIQPTNQTGSPTDATIDIGEGSYRWKDLYLSGGVYLGGTGAANLLDDYEEGTWTPTYEPATGAFGAITYDPATSGSYTKIGNLVYVTGFIRTDALTIGTASGSLRISGLPFTPSGVPNDPVNFASCNSWTGNVPSEGSIASSAEIVLLYRAAINSGNNTGIQASDLAGGANANQIIFSAIYQV